MDDNDHFVLLYFHLISRDQKQVEEKEVESDYDYYDENEEEVVEEDRVWENEIQKRMKMIEMMMMMMMVMEQCCN
jgi:hypothetical protein